MKKIVSFSIVALLLVGCNEADRILEQVSESNNSEEVAISGNSESTLPLVLDTGEVKKLPVEYAYKAINNSGASVVGEIGDYKIEIVSNYEEEVQSQSRHYSIVVEIGDEVSQEIPIQLSYMDKTIIVAVYKDNHLVGMSEILTVNDIEPLMLVNIDVTQ